MGEGVRETFLRPDVGGKLKISLPAWRGSRAADTSRSVRELAADPVSTHSWPIMHPVMCVRALHLHPHQPPTPPLTLKQHQPERAGCQKVGIKPRIKHWLSHAQVMINGLYSLTRRRKENTERATDGSFQLITKHSNMCLKKKKDRAFSRVGAAQQLARPATQLQHGEMKVQST